MRPVDVFDETKVGEPLPFREARVMGFDDGIEGLYDNPYEVGSEEHKAYDSEWVEGNCK